MAKKKRRKPSVRFQYNLFDKRIVDVYHGNRYQGRKIINFLKINNGLK